MKRTILILSLTLPALGCANTSPASGEAICEATAGMRLDHAAALADAPDVAVVTGARLLRALSAACD